MNLESSFVPLKMLADKDHFLNQVVEVFMEIWANAFGLKDSRDFVTSHKTILWHTMWVPRDHPVWKGVRLFFFLWVVCKSVPSGCQMSTSASWGNYICRVTAARNRLFQDHACDSWWQRSGSKEKMRAKTSLSKTAKS